MSLTVDLFDPTRGRYAYVDAIERDAAGFEVYRWKLWGAPATVRAGARFLPQLARDDLFVYPEELDAFAEECRTLHALAPALARSIWGAPDCAAEIRRYLERFLAAIELAARRDLGVCIS